MEADVEGGWLVRGLKGPRKASVDFKAIFNKLGPWVSVVE